MMVPPRMRSRNRNTLRPQPVNEFLWMRNRAEHHRCSRQRRHLQLTPYRPRPAHPSRIQRRARSARSISSSRSTTKSARSSAASGSRSRPAGNSVVQSPSGAAARSPHREPVRDAASRHPANGRAARRFASTSVCLRQPSCRRALPPHKHRHLRALRNQPRLIAITRCRILHAIRAMTCSTASDTRPYPRESTSTSHPRSFSARASAITNGVFPAPPTDRFPTLTTGHAAAHAPPSTRIGSCIQRLRRRHTAEPAAAAAIPLASRVTLRKQMHHRIHRTLRRPRLLLECLLAARSHRCRRIRVSPATTRSPHPRLARSTTRNASALRSSSTASRKFS